MATLPVLSREDVYLHRLKGLQTIRTLAGSQLELCLPKIVVVGDQSSGKSSLLERLTSIKFPVKSGICTKAAIVAECSHNEDSSELNCFEVSHLSEGFKKVDLKDLQSEILRRQSELLKVSGKKVCTDEILVRVSGPLQMDIIVIDLPGIIHTGDGKEETRLLINKYIKHPETLIMLVSEATRNDETMEAIDMAIAVDPEGKRTLRVLTKFDNFDSDESKIAAVNLVKKDFPETGRGAIGLILSPHAVVCSPEGQNNDYCSDKESRSLLELGLSLDRAGVASLKTRLPPIFAELIQTNLPKMLESIVNETAKKEVELARIGVEPVSGDRMAAGIQRALLEQENALHLAITVHMTEFKEAVHAIEATLKEKWVFDKMEENVFTCVLFQGAEAFRECTQDVLSMWKPLLQTYIDRVQSRTLELLCNTVQNIAPDRLREVVIKLMNRVFKDDMYKTFAQHCWDAFDKELDWGTVNHYFNSKYDAERKLPDSLIDNLVKGLADMATEGTVTQSKICEVIITHKEKLQAQQQKESWDEQQQRRVFDAAVEAKAWYSGKIREVIISYKEKLEAQQQKESLHEQQQQRVFDAVKAWYSVEKKTFTDVVLKTTKTHVFDSLRQWLRMRLTSDKGVLAAAEEDEDRRHERIRLKDELEKLGRCLAEVRGMM